MTKELLLECASLVYGKWAMEWDALKRVKAEQDDGGLDMRGMHFSATIYAKRQPRPLVGDEIFPDGAVGITFQPTPSLTYTELSALVTELGWLLQEMGKTNQVEEA